MKAIYFVILYVTLFPGIISSQESDHVIEYPIQLFITDTLTVKGHFDGHSDNTFLEIDGQKFNAVSETHSQSSFILINSRLGALKGQLIEDSFSVPLQLQLLNLNTSLSKSNLKRGTRTTLELKVEGLSDSQEDIQIQLTNKTPNLITLEDGDDQIWTLPARNLQKEASKKFKIRGIRPGNFNLKVDLHKVPIKISEVENLNNANTVSNEKDDEKNDEDVACGSIYGKVENKLGAGLGNIVVFVKSECNLCPPEKRVDTLKITNDCFKYEPSWAVVPKGAVVTVKNTSEIECHINPQLSTKFNDKTGFEEVLEPGEEKSFVAKEYFENDSGNPRGYGLRDEFHKRVDMSFFIAPNACYCTLDEDGNYEIGELPPGSYTLKIYTQLYRLNTPTATVVVKSNERTRKDFELTKAMRKVKKKSN